MKRKDFYFELPENLIAQFPLDNRDTSRLMILDRKSNQILHKNFFDLIDFLEEGDCLLLNNTRVIPSRLMCKKAETGANVEVFMLRPHEKNSWAALVKPSKKVKAGTVLSLGDIEIKILEKRENQVIVSFPEEVNIEEFMASYGKEPLPPYIKRNSTELDKERYQTVFAREKGAVAAPTAGLHFTDELLEKINKKGITVAYLTLHVGLGTFLPVKTENIDEHKMHSEYYELSKETAELIKHRTGKLVCVGTTTVRTIESIYQKNNCIKEDSGWTDIFIYPGYKFLAVDSMITNFHTPESTLVMLVSAFAGKDLIFKSYNEAIEKRYRFFSYGDSMLIL